MNPFKIISMGKYLPKQVPSSELEEKFKIPKGWSSKYSGVEFRHHVTHEHNDVMGAQALEQALEKGALKLSDLDLILYAGSTFDYPIPNQASLIKKALQDGCKVNTPTIDIDCTCLSFVAAINLAAQLLNGIQYSNIAIVSSEISSKHLNSNNKETLTLFGDGAVAVILQHSPESNSGLIKGQINTYSEGYDKAIIKGGGLKHPIQSNPYHEELHSFKMKGKELLKLAKQRIPEFMDDFFSEMSVHIEDIPVVIPHQASKAGLNLLNSLYMFKPTQIKTTLNKYGNCIAASIPLTLYDCIELNELKKGDLCLLTGTSAGFSIGASLIQL